MSALCEIIYLKTYITYKMVIMAIKIISTLGPTSFNPDIIHELDLACGVKTSQRS